MKFTDCDQNFQSLATLFRSKESIDQITNVTSALGVLELTRANPQNM